MPTLKRAKRFSVTPASSRTFWTDFLLSFANAWSRSDALLEEAVDAALDDLRQGGLGLALLAGGGLGDAALVLDRLGRDVLAGEVLRGERGDVLRDALGDLGVRPCPARQGRRPAAAGPGWCGACTQRRNHR